MPGVVYKLWTDYETNSADEKCAKSLFAFAIYLMYLF